MGNGAKAQQKRERNAKDAPKGASSQNKSNQAAQTTICKRCFQTFQSTSGEAKLTEHSVNHKGFTFAQCFPDFVAKK